MTDKLDAEAVRVLLSATINKAAYGLDHADDESDAIAAAVLDKFVVSLPREDADLDAIEAREQAATPGPWQQTPETAAGCVWVRRGGPSWRPADCEPLFNIRGEDAPKAQREADAEFIAHARTDVPALLARVRTAEAAIEKVQEYAKDRYLYGKRTQSTVHSARIASDLFDIVGGRPR